MWNKLRESLHIFIPQSFHDPFGLLARLIRSRDRAAWFAIETTLIGILFTPLDLLFQVNEKRLYKNASYPNQPLIFVCGAPRTGTTLVTQVLINHLPVSYFNNLTSIFPRSPITANLLFRRGIKQKPVAYSSYYGKSDHLSGPNDALYIWDRWLDKDRSRIKASLSQAEKSDMVHFFGAYQNEFPKPLINKNNNLNTQASLVADVFDNAHFICLTRDSQFLAQSLLRARLEMHGDVNFAYGIHDPDLPATKNYIEDVCRQVLFHEQKINEQQQKIGLERFWIVPYEQFCNQPGALVEHVSERILGKPILNDDSINSLQPFTISNKVNLEPETFKEIERTLDRLNQEAATKQTTSSKAILT